MEVVGLFEDFIGADPSDTDFESVNRSRNPTFRPPWFDEVYMVKERDTRVMVDLLCCTVGLGVSFHPIAKEHLLLQ